jgi:dihydroorotate dehydrogenase (NAD+) catalytic subunit
VVSGARKRTKKPLFAKLSPNVTRIGDMARAVEAGGADAVTAVNTLLGLALDWRTRRPGVATVQGGYSGPGIKPVALRCAWECAQAVSLPIIGAGGIQTADDVLQFMVAGCSAVQVGTSSFWNPARLAELAQEVDALLTAEGIDDVNDLVGALRDGRTRAARPRPNTDEHAPAAAGRSAAR